MSREEVLLMKSLIISGLIITSDGTINTGNEHVFMAHELSESLGVKDEIPAIAALLHDIGLVALTRQSPPHFGTGHRECLAPRSSPVILECVHVKKILLFFKSM